MNYPKDYPITNQEREFLQKFSDLIKESRAWIEYEKGGPMHEGEYADTIFSIRAHGIFLGLDELFHASKPSEE